MNMGFVYGSAIQAWPDFACLEKHEPMTQGMVVLLNDISSVGLKGFGQAVIMAGRKRTF